MSYRFVSPYHLIYKVMFYIETTSS